MMSNLSSIYNTIDRQAESLGKPAAVHTLHNTKSMPLRKETPGNSVVRPAAQWTVKYLHFCAFPCLVPAAWARKRCPWGSSSKDMPTTRYTLPSLTWNHLCESPHLCISMLTQPEKPHTWQLRKLKCPAYLWSWGCYREAVTRVQPEYLSQSITFPPTQEETTSDLQAGSLNRWLLLPTMCRHKCFTWKSRWELAFSSRSTATVPQEVLTPPSFLTGVLRNTCNFMRLSFYQVSLQWW